MDNTEQLNINHATQFKKGTSYLAVNVKDNMSIYNFAGAYVGEESEHDGAVKLAKFVSKNGAGTFIDRDFLHYWKITEQA